MKKKSLLLLVGGLLLGIGIIRASVVYSGYLVNEPALAYSNNYTLDLKTGGVNGRSISKVAATCAYSSATVANVTFADGGLSTNHLTVSSNSGLVGVQASATITVVSTTSLQNSILYVNGVRLRSFYEWKVGSSTVTTATNIAAVINRLSGIQASAAGGVVYATATAAGVAGNSITLTKYAATNLTLSGATFTGGVDNAYVNVSGLDHNGVAFNVNLVQGTDWTRQSVSSMTAKAISDAWMANSTLSALVHSTWTTGGVVYATATAVGVNAYAVTASPALNLVWSAATFGSGTDPDWTLNSAVITKTGHGLYTALPVLYSTGAIAIGGLTNQTTYYAIRQDANHFELATTSTGAIAGAAIVLTSTSTAGPHTYTLAPLAIAGTFSFKWQTSDDNVTYTDVAVSSVSLVSPGTAGTASWDFGTVGHRYLRAAEQAGTRGAWNLQIAVTGRNDN